MRITFSLGLGILLLPWNSGFAQMSQQELLNDITNKVDGILYFMHGEDKMSSVRAMLNDGRTTPNDMAMALIHASETLANSPDRMEAAASLFAIDLLSECSTPVVLPFLEKEMASGDKGRALHAGWASMDIAINEPAMFGIVSKVMENRKANDIDFHRAIYVSADTRLKHLPLADAQRHAFYSFLVNATTFETHAAEFLDNVLCANFPSYAESPDRLRFAARMAACERASGRSDGPFAAIEALLRAAEITDRKLGDNP